MMRLNGRNIATAAALLAISLTDGVEARRSHHSAPPPPPRQPQPDPFAGFDQAFSAPQPQPEHRGGRGGGSGRQPSPAAQPAWQPPSQPSEPASGAKKDDGADQDDENDPEWYKNNAKSYPCYKLTEQALFNFEQMRNTDGDWEVYDPLNRQVSFNFCTFADASAAGCSKDTFAYMKNVAQCKELTSDEPKAEINSYVERASSIKGSSDQEGIRIERGGGAICPADETQLYSITIDVWCNPDVTGSPSEIKSEKSGPLDFDEADPCNVYVSMEHANGCSVLDLHPYLVVLGCFMIFSGVCLQWLGPQAQQRFMIFIVRLGTFLIICSFAFERNYFAFADPGEPPQKKDPVKLLLALIIAFVAQWIVGYLFQYSIRLAPTLLGVYFGYYFAIYIIIAVNGLGGVFGSAAKATHDTIDPLMSYVYQAFGCFIGGLIGYCYSAAFIALVQTLISAYLIVRGTTMFRNMGFPNELALMQSTSIESNNMMKLPPAFYGYCLAILVLWIIFLRNHIRRRDNPEQQKYLDETA